MKADVGADQIAGPVLAVGHVIVGGPDLGDRLRRSQARCPCGGGGLDDLAQIEQVHQEFLGRPRIEMPMQDVRIEHVPVGSGAHARAHVLARRDQALGGEHAIGFAQGRARYRQMLAQIDLVRELIAGLVEAADDLPAELVREIFVDVAERLAREWATRPHARNLRLRIS
jgi:hypothetical protein